ncbi:hypothetical protein C5167_043685 [Papaver somniferum]|uniref:beta-ketoacyl-[acyl-carrier-protein] synthase I n=1 Tax=Papaver somniferum TaxID=3469 RepID=A0A4Y7LAC2_PAPSO|nr:hypothetical protein C5167_043685 [Papaver somniferum]
MYEDFHLKFILCVENSGKSSLSQRDDKFMLYMLTAGKKALDDGGISEEVMNELDKTRCGVLIGSGMGGMKVFNYAIEALRISYKKMNPFCVSLATTSMGSSMLTIDLEVLWHVEHFQKAKSIRPKLHALGILHGSAVKDFEDLGFFKLQQDRKDSWFIPTKLGTNYFVSSSDFSSPKQLQWEYAELNTSDRTSNMEVDNQMMNTNSHGGYVLRSDEDVGRSTWCSWIPQRSTDCIHDDANVDIPLDAMSDRERELASWETDLKRSEQDVKRRKNVITRDLVICSVNILKQAVNIHSDPARMLIRDSRVPAKLLKNDLANLQKKKRESFMLGGAGLNKSGIIRKSRRQSWISII